MTGLVLVWGLGWGWGKGLVPVYCDCIARINEEELVCELDELFLQVGPKFGRQEEQSSSLLKKIYSVLFDDIYTFAKKKS